MINMVPRKGIIVLRVKNIRPPSCAELVEILEFWVFLLEIKEEFFDGIRT